MNIKLRSAIAAIFVSFISFAYQPAHARAIQIETVVLGKQIIHGVLVHTETGFQLLKNAGTRDEQSFVARAARGDVELHKALAALAIERQPIPLVKEVEHKLRNGILVPVPVDRPVYPAIAFRDYEGILNEQGEIEIERVVAPADQSNLDKVMPLAITTCRNLVKDKEKPELDFAFSLLEKTGMLESMLKAVAPLFKDPDKATDEAP